MGKKFLPVTAAAIVGLSVVLAGQPSHSDSEKVASGPGSALDLDLYAELLDRYTAATHDVAGTRVDYSGLSRSSRWRKLIAQLTRSRPDQLRSRDEKLTFWINAYNILAIQTVIENYPVASIRDAGSFFSPVWKRVAGRIGGQDVSLHQIEHEILRPLGDPRIHAAIVCASTSCPSLAREPFRVDPLAARLDEAMRSFIANPSKGFRIDRSSGSVTLSKIFDWFEADFGEAGVLEAIRPYLSPEDATWLQRRRGSLTVEHFDYDWSLNDLVRKADASEGPA